jgi:hypothetical protein
VRSIDSRLRRLETVGPADAMVTLEELCRAMWRENPSHFRTIAAKQRLGLFVTLFESEDADPQNSRRMGRKFR